MHATMNTSALIVITSHVENECPLHLQSVANCDAMIFVAFERLYSDCIIMVINMF